MAVAEPPRAYGPWGPRNRQGGARTLSAPPLGYVLDRGNKDKNGLILGKQ